MISRLETRLGQLRDRRENKVPGQDWGWGAGELGMLFQRDALRLRHLPLPGWGNQVGKPLPVAKPRSPGNTIET